MQNGQASYIYSTNNNLELILSLSSTHLQLSSFVISAKYPFRLFQQDNEILWLSQTAS